MHFPASSISSRQNGVSFSRSQAHLVRAFLSPVSSISSRQNGVSFSRSQAGNPADAPHNSLAVERLPLSKMQKSGRSSTSAFKLNYRILKGTDIVFVEVLVANSLRPGICQEL